MPHTSHDAFVAAYRLDTLGYGSPITKDELFQAWRQSNDPLWLHLDLTAPSNIDHYLHDIAQLDHSQCTAMCEEVPRPRVAHFGNGPLRDDLKNHFKNNILSKLLPHDHFTTS